MGRPKKEKSTEPKRTVEDLNDDELSSLTYKHKDSYETALAMKKKADADFKNVCKKAVADLGKEVIDDIKLLIDLENEEDEAKAKVSDRVQRILRIVRWQGLTLPGVQMDMFASAKSKYYEDGRRSGLKGEPRTPPKTLAAASSEYNDWLEGHAKGNDERNAQLEESASGPGHGDKAWADRLRAQNEEAEKAMKAH